MNRSRLPMALCPNTYIASFATERSPTTVKMRPMFLRPWEREESIGTSFDGGMSSWFGRSTAFARAPNLPVTALA